MTRYLISFDDGAMTFPDEDLPNVAKAGHEVVQEAKDAGVWVFGGGVESQRASVVATEGRDYYERKIAEGKTQKEAARALKRQISDIVYRQLVRDAQP